MAGDAIPEDAIPPALFPELEFAYSAFCELSSDRNENGAVPWHVIDAFARRYRISHIDEFEELVGHIRLIEKTFRDVSAELAPKSEG